MRQRLGRGWVQRAPLAKNHILYLFHSKMSATVKIITHLALEENNTLGCNIYLKKSDALMHN